MSNTVIIGKPRPGGVTVIKDETPSGTATVAGPGTGASGVAVHEAAADPHPQYLEAVQAFAEFDTQAKRVQARQNLELNYIDGGTF